MEKEMKKIEGESDAPLAQPPSDVALEKAAVPSPPPPPVVNKAHDVDDPKAIVPVDKASEPLVKKPSGGSIDRDVALAEVEKEKKFSYIKAWEESEKTKAENKAQKKLSTLNVWENSKKASLEAKLRKLEEQLERKKAEYAEKIKNKVGLIHKQAEEKRAAVEAIRREELLKAEEMAAKHRATGSVPKKLLGCF
ncbi:hypothetical protein FNV43_RR15234 [Rhamnella rubrinervis]|uniref:Remorin n=1 Tax=Rhamnella rubrinervis TaxID=2594499 RepID=A0A8K0E1F9_9ROSA|nr:hypothetical protein FNV43_RR15234 [Rhamnella rubrinervis]